MRYEEKRRIAGIRDERALQQGKQRQDDMAQILTTDGGRRILMWLVTISGIYRRSNAVDTNGLAYDAGKRDFGLEVLSLANSADAPAVLKAMQERIAWEEETRRLIDAANK